MTRVWRAIPGTVAVVILVAASVVVVAPFLWMFSTSVRPSLEAYDLPPRWIPTSVTLDNYDAALNHAVPLVTQFFNSLFIAVTITVSQMITSALAGYAFAKLRFPGRNVIFIVLLTTLMIPIQVTIIPLFIGMSQVGLVNTPWSLILPGLTHALGIFLMRQFFISLPGELIESAKIDGAGPFTTFRKIALPLARPALAALGVIVFLASWNNYFAPLVFLRSVETATLPLGLVLLLGPYKSGNPAVVMAGTALAVIPALIVFLIAQRWIVESLSRSGIRG
ncbi:MAG: carbohydrate ABC transporter permease [Acidimicrobiia bacterium]|nr:carbohydrate ABC transporter permease [Acidimicrobiia bacterium]